MKLLIASDVHGSIVYLKKLLTYFETNNFDKLVLLGDILYHGPRNDLPEGYDPKSVANTLNGYKDKIICIKGNCDSEVDQMVLNFPLLPSYSLILDGNFSIYLTHGHLFNEETPLNAPSGSVVMLGHFHVPKITNVNGVYYINTGSVSIPKENSKHGFIVYENKTFNFVSLDGEVYKTFSL